MTTASSEARPRERMSIGGRFDRWLYDGYADVSDGSLAIVRILYAGVLLILFQPDYTWIGSFNDAFFFPPIGPFLLLEGFPPGYVLDALTVLTSGALVAVLFGWRTRLASWTASTTMLVGFGFVFSFGKIDHNIFLLITPVLAAEAGWGRQWSLDARAGRIETGPAPRWPLVIAMLLLGFMMFSAGAQKVAEGWLDPSVQSSRGHHLNRLLVGGHDRYLSVPVAELDSALLYELMDVGTVAFECGFMVAILWPRVFRVFVAALTFFHLTVLLVLNIPFWGNLIPYLMFFPLVVPQPLGRLLDRSERHLPRSRQWILIAAGTVAVASPLLAIGPPLSTVADAAGIDSELVTAHALVIVGSGVGLVLLRRALYPIDGAR